MLKRISPKTMPDHLRQRLADIPHQQVLCRDLERLWAPWLAGELASEQTAPLELHEKACVSCQGWLSALRGARPVAAPAAPPGLQRRLSRISNQPLKVRVPLWLADIRYSAAVSYAAASLVFLLVGDPSRIALEHLPTVTSSLALAADKAEERGEEVLDSWTADFRKGLEESQVRARQLGEGVQERFDLIKSEFLKRTRREASSEGS
ncbi:MAG: hypothetical protein K0U98_13250 [Deltaproteobacteria bacterium]|nr:hypothetical protein [Deltaproteobacteria bacterium]